MRFLIISTDYPEFLRWLYGEHPGLEKQPYEKQMGVRVDSLFGVADFYSSNLRKLGHEAHYVYANNRFMQGAWASEHGIGFVEGASAGQAARTVLRHPWRVLAKTPLRRYLEGPARSVVYSLRKGTWFYGILAAQIRHYEPAVLFNHDMHSISHGFLRDMKPYVGLLVGQHAATSLSDAEDFSCYDLVISSFPPTVGHFRTKGIPAEFHRLGFEPGVLSCLESKDSTFDVTFIGSFHDVHSSRVQFLEALCDRFDQIRIWGQNIDHLSSTSPIRKCYVGPAWGREMYHIMRDSKITLNHHGDIAPYANNARLYEATGVGTLLITDWKQNLPEMFEPGKEVVAYRTPEECAQLIQYYLEHDDERQAIARAGQARTLREHTYYRRMEELADIVCKYL